VICTVKTTVDKQELAMKLNTVVSEVNKRLSTPFYKAFKKGTPYAWDNYKKHKEVVAATATHSVVYFKAANRIGKTFLMGYCLRAWATGEYPEDWCGRKFKDPVNIWIIGVTHQQVREVIQKMLVESALKPGDGGFFSEDLIIKKSYKPKPSGALLDLYVKHVPTGGTSHITFKCYEEKVDAYQGAKVDILLFDEEPPQPVFDECILRTTATNIEDPNEASGLALIAATPLKGRTKFTRAFDNPDDLDRKKVIATWEDVPHLSEKTKLEMLRKMAPHMIAARTKGIEYLGSGMVFPVEPQRYVLEKPIDEVKRHWLLINGLDLGRHTMAIFGAIDPVTQDLYIYGEKEYIDVVVPIKAAALLKISIAPYSADTSSAKTQNFEIDTRTVGDHYTEMGMNLCYPNKKLKESVIDTVLGMMLGGSLKIDPGCKQLIDDLTSACRDENHNIIKDTANPLHAFDAFLYLIQRRDMAKSIPQIEYDNMQYAGQIIEQVFSEHEPSNNGNTHRYV